MEIMAPDTDRLDGSVCEVWRDPDGTWFAEIRIPGVRAIRDVQFHGPIVLDPHYTPPWTDTPGPRRVHDDDAQG